MRFLRVLLGFVSFMVLVMSMPVQKDDSQDPETPYVWVRMSLAYTAPFFVTDSYPTGAGNCSQKRYSQKAGERFELNFDIDPNQPPFYVVVVDPRDVQTCRTVQAVKIPPARFKGFSSARVEYFGSFERVSAMEGRLK